MSCVWSGVCTGCVSAQDPDAHAAAGRGGRDGGTACVPAAGWPG